MTCKAEVEGTVAGRPEKFAPGSFREGMELSGLSWPALKVRGRARSTNFLDRVAGTRALCRRAQSLISDWELWGLALTDELTGLLNRRGFWFLACHQLNLADRNRYSSILFFCDLDDFKRINDQFGHEVGDHALLRTARVLKKTFRRSDVLARIGGDEFLALALETKGGDAGGIEDRLQANLKSANAAERRYQLSLSLGTSRRPPAGADSLRNMIVRADRDLLSAKCRASSMPEFKERRE